MGLRNDWIEALSDRLAPGVQELLKTNNKPEEKVELIFEYDSMRDLRHSHIQQAIRRYGGTIKRELPLINAVAVEIPVSGLQGILPGNVKRVWNDSKVKPCLNVAVPAIHADLAHQSGWTGRGVTVAVIDTGIDQHADLTTPTNRIVGWKDFVNDKLTPYDDNGHGTHVAGIIAGNGAQSGLKYTGVAPEARLVGVKVLDKDGGGSVSQVISGVDWVVRNRHRFRVNIINLSLGGATEKGYMDDPMSHVVEEAWKRGLVVCAAAGNNGPDFVTINTPGIAPSVITVGNMDDRNTASRHDDQLDDSSSRGPTLDQLEKPDILAPGTNIVSLKSGGGYVSHTGTSMATPMVSGAVALMLQQNPRLKPFEVKSILLKNAEDRGYQADLQGKGYLDLQKTLNLKEGEQQRAALESKKRNYFMTLLRFIPQLVNEGNKKMEPREMLSMLAKTFGLCDEKKSKPKEKAPSVPGIASLMSSLNLTPGTLIGLLSSFKEWMSVPGLPI